MGEERTVPAFKICVDGSEIPPEARLAVLSITVDNFVDTADLFAVRLRNKNSKWSDDPLFREGKKVKIDLGYEGKSLSTVIEGEVTGWKVSYPREGPSTLVVIGHDKYHRLRRAKKSRSFLQMKDSDIVSQVAGDLGLSAETDATTEQFEYVFQNNQTDIDFLIERARRIGYEVDVDGTKLLFKKPKHSKPKVAKLKYSENCLYFEPLGSTSGQYGKVEIRGWNPKEKKEIVGKATKGDISCKMGGDKAGAEVAETAFGEQLVVLTDCPVYTQSEADAMAKAKMEEISLAYTLGKGAALGDPAIRGGTVAELEGCGQAYDGPYYVVRAVHNYHGAGYTTTFHIRRTALMAVAGPPPTWEQKPAAPPPEEEAPKAPEIKNPRWSQSQVPSGRPVVMSVEVKDIDPGTAGTFKVYRRSGSPPEMLDTKDGQVGDNGKLEATWDYSYEDGREIQPADFFFKATCQGKEATSGTLKVRDTIDLHYTYADSDVPLAGARFIMKMPDGKEIRGVLDNEGKAQVRGISPGKCTIRFPDYEEASA